MSAFHDFACSGDRHLIMDLDLRSDYDARESIRALVPLEQPFGRALVRRHEDIPQLIGTSRETVTRLLKDFREKKMISIKGSSLTVCDRAALEALVLLCEPRCVTNLTSVA